LFRSTPHKCSPLSILDVKARDQSGRQFNVEMQMLTYRYYEKRILYYGCKLHQQQLHEGDDYLKLQPTISISFLDHVLFPQVPDYHLRFRLLEESRHFPFTDDLEIHILGGIMVGVWNRKYLRETICSSYQRKGSIPWATRRGRPNH
jgi:predicted transposase/invertase (TIGR01784 family)